MSDNITEKVQKLIESVKKVIAQDEALRQQFNIGTKFRFIRDRLNSLLSYVETSTAELLKKEEQQVLAPAEDETLVYVYLFNVHGLDFQSWYKMLSQSVFYEYSVNRPIYAEQLGVESNIRSKSNINQHGFLTVIVKKQDILPTASEMQDSLGNKLIKIREGSLNIKKMMSFHHAGQVYEMTADGQLKKKS